MSICFVSGDVVPFTGHELRLALKSRATLAWLFLVALTSVGAMAWLGRTSGGPLWLIGLSVGLLTSFLFLYIGTTVVLVAFAYFRGQDRISEPVISAVVGTGLGLISSWLFGRKGPVAADVLSDTLLHILAGTLVSEGLALAYVKVIRQRLVPTRSPVPERAGQPRPIDFAGIPILSDRLLTVESHGHYLNVVTRDESFRRRLRLSDVLSQLDDEDGVLVHRSRWLAWHAIHQIRRRSGGIELILEDGTAVGVARSRRADVEALLKRRGHGS